MPRALPTELIRHIVKLALPVVSMNTYKERYQLLLACSLVNSTWRALAKEVLYKEVFVRTQEDLAEVLEGKEDQWGRHVHLGAGANFAELNELGKFPAALDSVKALSISSFLVKAYKWRPLKDLVTLHMRVLHLGEGIVNYRVPGPSQLLDGRLFRSLTTLSLFDNYLSSGRPSWTNWFTPMNLPQLCRLTIGTMGASSTARTDHDFIQALELVAPRIRDLTITQGRPIAMFTSNFPWSAFSTIRRLALYLQVGDPLALIEVALAELPSRALSHLLIGYVRSPSRRRAQVSDVWVKEILPKLMQALEARSGVDSLQALEVLMLHYGREAAQLVTRKTLHPLGLIMKARGGTLDRRVGWGEPTEMLEWERYVDVW